MGAVFDKLLGMSLSATWLILAVLLLRVVLKKAPKWMFCVLWGMVAVRLLCPISLESTISLVPNFDPLSQRSESFWQEDKMPTMQDAVTDYAFQNSVPTPEPKQQSKGLDVATGAAMVWLVGMAGLMIYGIGSYLWLYRQVRVSIPLESGVYLCDQVPSPFILGVVKPKIYLPSGLNREETGYILAHEKTHLKRFDYLWKPLGFALLSVYWFNPAIWVAYIFLCRDIELACDERVIEDMALAEKKAYSMTLLSCSMPRRRITACPLAFGEVSVKSRVKNVLNFKKPAFWVLAVAFAASIVLGVCFLTDPKTPETDMSLLNYKNLVSLVNEKKLLEVSDNGWKMEVFGEQVGQFLKEAAWEQTREPEGATADITISIYDFLELRFFADNPNLAQVVCMDASRFYDMGQGQFSDVEDLISTAQYIPEPEPTVEETLQPEETEPTAPVQEQKLRRLTLADVITLSQKGEDLLINDIWGFYALDDQETSFAMVFPIDSLFSLWVGDINSSKPGFVYLWANDAAGDYIDIRKEDVADFLKKYRDDILGNACTEYLAERGNTINLQGDILVESHEVIESADGEYTDATIYLLVLYSKASTSKHMNSIWLAMELTFRMDDAGNCTLLDAYESFGNQYEDQFPSEIIAKYPQRPGSYLFAMNHRKVQEILEGLPAEDERK